jgi:mRNA-degrading endonuclease RelE of RelBE toxin-antitoxin system
MPRQMRRKVHENHDFLSRNYVDLKDKLRNEKDALFRSRISKYRQILILTTFCNQKRYFVIFQLSRMKW